eukprot:691808-Pelagomonas_calceolata.AAC.3
MKPWSCSPCMENVVELATSLMPQAMLDYEALELQPFYAGAAVRLGPQFHRVADPLRASRGKILTYPHDRNRWGSHCHDSHATPITAIGEGELEPVCLP